MSLLDFDNLIRSLAGYLATAASLQYTGTPRSVWAHTAVERDAADTYSVVRQYGGAVPWTPVSVSAVQIRTVSKGGGSAAAFAQSSALFAALFAADGRPLRNVILGGGIRLSAADCQQPPSFLSLDDRGRAEVVFNVSIKAVPA